ncbi:MAG: hypothetical protein A2Z06_01495 [Candidatus Glassbacteria bacterium RBG_16_58_8]|uniref:Uncharacterized protein n=1 Tax=Candidatus Glassbacteria bacterium RBG_16_58_8 TaxID=1817866 RepID=A0A1F5YAI9_9BACT|nr:MAG: hypothetical protein A2Z06_01495 [Candidatus Glassbacteria bacterium RBG_16_58_8]
MPKVKAAVSPRVAGQLIELFVDVGSRVKAGDLLGRLANDDLRAQERQIEAEIASQKALLEEARGNMEDLKLDFERHENLYQAGAVSPSSYEAARTAYRAAEARVGSAEARLENARAMLEVMMAEIEKTYIRAPFDGAILRKEAEVGEIVGPVYGGEAGGDVSALVTLCDMSSLEIEVDVNEAYISRLREGMEASIVLDALPGHSYPGEVRKIVPTADRQKATVQVKVAFREIDDRVLPEMGAKVSFYGEEEGGAQLEPVVSIPASAIRVVEGKTVVLAVEGGKVSVKQITAGHVVAGMAPVFSGISPGETVIVRGPESLGEGQRVRTAADEE